MDQSKTWNLANKLTLSRIILSPVFFIIYLLPRFFPRTFENAALWIIIILWMIFIISEITDYFDGLAARKLGQTSDFGKLFDPFADTLVQITCFFCFLIDGVWGGGMLPAALFLIVIYREFGILFIRNIMLKKGVTLGARITGKIKTILYIIAAAATLLAASLERLNVYENLLPYFKTAALIIFTLSVIMAVVSFIDYLIICQKTGKSDKND